MARIRKLIERIGPWRVVYAGLALNAVLLVKTAAFDPNIEFKPVCHNTAFGGGFEIVRGHQSEEFREAIRFNLKRYGFRISQDGRNYVSLVTIWTTDSEKFWWNTNGAVRAVIRKVGIKPTLSERGQYKAAHGFGGCEVTKAYALESGDSASR